MQTYFIASATATAVGLIGIIFNVFSISTNRAWMCVIGLSLTAVAVAVWAFGYWMLRFSF